jgi:nucleoside 2-deoxyribosyltransferase
MTANLAYFIVPVGSDESFESKRAALQAAAERRGWATHFPSYSLSYPNQGTSKLTSFSLPDFVTEIENASLVVADLSLERPSCYYELGVAQAVGAPVLLLAAVGTMVHQVADRNNVHLYSDLEELSSLLDNALKGCDDLPA